MRAEEELSPQELLRELCLLVDGQHATVRRVSIDKWTIRFQQEMTTKQRRQHEFDRFWLSGNLG